MEFLFLVVPILLVIFLIIFSIVALWRKVPQDKALVVTGLKKRVISGGGGLVIPIFERTDRISLENMKIEVKTTGALTEQGVDIIADGVAVIKVKSDKESILASVEQFNTGNEARTIAVIEDIAKDVLEGKLREIISKMTVEEIYKDREKFASQVQEVAALDLAEMGLEIKAFTIRDISDDNGYLQALGKKRISEVKRDAQIAEAEAARETKIKTAEANRLGEEARLVSETQIAEASKEKELRVQAYRREQESSKAIADLAYEIEANRVKKEVTETQMQIEIVRREKEIEVNRVNKDLAETEMQIEILRKQKETELADQEAARREKELEATVVKVADAERYRLEKAAEAAKFRDIADAQARAESIRLEGIARSEAKKLEGMAEVEIIREKGKAEAEAMLKKAEAFKLYNDAAVTQMIIEKLPDIAKSVAEPLSKTEKIVVVDNGGSANSKNGAAKVSGYVTDIISSLPETVEALTGINLVETIGSAVKRDNGKVKEKKEDSLIEG
ncbi:MAG: flotillin family protein [Clostridiales bacterium]|jgi:flotillin|nr:flotillin family protein [Clostridiales bacterium]